MNPSAFYIRVSLIVLSIFCAGALYAQKDLTRFVDPDIGTAHCRWFHYTPGALPFGMAKPAPATNGSYGNASGWEATGYDSRHTSIEGFPNFHEFQVGGIVFAPTTGPLQTVPGKLETPDSGYRSHFDHKNEISTAGYYSVLLKDYKIRAELTATPRVAFHRYTFPQTTEAHILFDIGNRQGESGPVKDAKVYLTPDGRVEGWVTTLPAYVQKYQPGAAITMFFSAELSKKPSAYGSFNGTMVKAGSAIATGAGAGLYLSFSTKEEEAIVVKAGLSYTSVENARLNLKEEAATVSFDAARTASKKIWNDYLGRIEVEGSRQADLVKFYTGLYHALLGRGLASDVNGAYPRHDGTVGQIPLGTDGKPLHQHYNTDAAWGIYWNLAQLWAIAYPEYYSDFIKSQLLMYKDAGWLADGIANSRYVSGVGTNFVGLVIAAAYRAGIRDFDTRLGYAAALKNELEGRNRPFGAGKTDVDRFRKYGYVNHLDKGEGDGERWQFSVSHTLEYAFSCFAVAQWAKERGDEKNYRELLRLSKAWEKVYDPGLKLVRPRLADGRFVTPFDPSQPWRGFQEGNAWQYTYFVPHDIEALVNKIGTSTFNKRLDSTFEIAQKAVFGGGATIDAFAGIAGIYNHGNQPNLHVSWLFNFSGRPSLTQKWVRAICNEFYGTEPVHGYGFGQDEDQGQLGAWYVLSSIGLFDVKGLTAMQPEMGIGSPLFDRITIHLNPRYYKGTTFTIQALNNTPGNAYIQSLQFNNRPLHRPFLSWDKLTNGGTLVLKMGERPVDQY
ncbi:GH92 family glycosyl hydrolase [Niabella beijingensis]|uniref:GH92 family glycosyl hydrolase n=1 Tax=Niabella beijingensis TaxID=2872700 RepID=UPI001CBC4FC9|nr:GH92 family glycosyl hydrolase [Niabella beijingensis]MBZ4191729.1 GH92 family glycosyl hydrolase [Niabella beijingensis]